MFLKIQFLEGISRKEFLENSPLKYVYVFLQEWQLGKRVNKQMKKVNLGLLQCVIWFIWEKGYEGEPIVRWL